MPIAGEGYIQCLGDRLMTCVTYCPLVARRLCTTHVNPTWLPPPLVCRLVALDKCLGFGQSAFVSLQEEVFLSLFYQLFVMTY